MRTEVAGLIASGPTLNESAIFRTGPKRGFRGSGVRDHRVVGAKRTLAG